MIPSSRIMPSPGDRCINNLGVTQPNGTKESRESSTLGGETTNKKTTPTPKATGRPESR